MEYASALFSAASSLAQRGFASNYTLDSASAQSAGSPSSATRPIQIGAWKVERATHNGPSRKQVSIWTCDKYTLAQSGASSSSSSASSSRRTDNGARRIDRAVEVLKKEAASLSRLRHPCVLEMAEPMEETRSSITFATEPVTACLRHAITASSSRRGSHGGREQDELELDEVEIQKGLSQLGKGLQFLHDSAKLVHGNLTPDAVVINAKGDWKIAGFGLSTYLFSSDGVPAKWEFPEYDHALPAAAQRDYDFIAPEYLLDEAPPAPSNDMYSLGCLIHMIHLKSGPPFSNRHSLQNARTNMDESLSRGMLRPQWRKLSDEAQSVLSQLLTRYPSSRLSAANFLTHQYFSSLLVSTLNFLSRDAFNSQSIEAQTGFLKGLVQVLPRFSDKVNRRKVLPSLLEETRKANLVPFLLPNILYIANKMDADAFRVDVLPSLKPLFGVKDPPQAVVSLLDNLQLFIDKCTPAVFRDEVMPLIYGALEGDNPIVLEKALKVVPGLSETLDYTTVKSTLFPKIAHVFSKTTLLSVKVNTLICFHSMIRTLDKFTLTEKLVPLLAKIKTKEPAVMIATLAVHEAMGNKVEVSAIATQILPQLWAMSMGPLLNVTQFEKFMSVIKRLGARVEEEHLRHLQELRRLEESSGAANGRSANGVMDFETLVRGGGMGSAANGSSKEVPNDLWADDSPRALTPAFSPPVTPALSPTPPAAFAPTANRTGAATSNAFSRPTQTARQSASVLGARSIPSTSFDSSAFGGAPSSSTPVSTGTTTLQPSYPSSFPVSNSTSSGMTSYPALHPGPAASIRSSIVQSTTSATYSSGRPNYDLGDTSSSPQSGSRSVFAPAATPATVPPPTTTAPSWNVVPPSQPQRPPQPPQQHRQAALPPGYNPSMSATVLQPKVVAPKTPAASDFGAWKDFDPLG